MAVTMQQAIAAINDAVNKDKLDKFIESLDSSLLHRGFLIGNIRNNKQHQAFPFEELGENYYIAMNTNEIYSHAETEILVDAYKEGGWKSVFTKQIGRTNSSENTSTWIFLVFEDDFVPYTEVPGEDLR